MGTPRCANQQGVALKTKTQAASEPTHDGVVLTPRMGRNKKEAIVRRTNNLKKYDAVVKTQKLVFFKVITITQKKIIRLLVR